MDVGRVEYGLRKAPEIRTAITVFTAASEEKGLVKLMTVPPTELVALQGVWT